MKRIVTLVAMAIGLTAFPSTARAQCSLFSTDVKCAQASAIVPSGFWCADLRVGSRLGREATLTCSPKVDPAIM